MDLLTLLIVILVIVWLLGYFGSGRVYNRGSTAGASSLVHLILVIVLILIVLRFLGVAF